MNTVYTAIKRFDSTTRGMSMIYPGIPWYRQFFQKPGGRARQKYDARSGFGNISSRYCYSSDNDINSELIEGVYSLTCYSCSGSSAAVRTQNPRGSFCLSCLLRRLAHKAVYSRL